MNRWIVHKKDYLLCASAASRFLRQNVVMPARVTQEDVMIKGFANECDIRQSRSAIDSFRRYLKLIGEQKFWFNWLDDSPEVYRLEHGVYPVFFCDSIAEDVLSFVDLQHRVSAQEALGFGEWIMTSPSTRWAIYGEQYNSETCLFLSLDEAASTALRFAFPKMITNSAQVPTQLWDEIDTLDRQSFEAEFLQNYTK